MVVFRDVGVDKEKKMNRSSYIKASSNIFDYYADYGSVVLRILTQNVAGCTVKIEAWIVDSQTPKHGCKGKIKQAKGKRNANKSEEEAGERDDTDLVVYEHNEEYIHVRTLRSDCVGRLSVPWQNVYFSVVYYNALLTACSGINLSSNIDANSRFSIDGSSWEMI